MDVFEIPRGAGSGFVWDRDGHIVTNYHVVREASDLLASILHCFPAHYMFLLIYGVVRGPGQHKLRGQEQGPPERTSSV